MTNLRVVERTKQEIIRLCHSGLDAHALRSELLKRIATVIPFDYVYFCTTDPATQLLTDSLMLVEPPAWLMSTFVENEFLQTDFNKFSEMLAHQRTVALLSEATQHNLERSQRYRNLLMPMALGDELRAIFVTNAGCWGTLCLDRERGAVFTPDDANFLTQVAPHIADGLRKALLVGEVAKTSVPDGPGVLILAADLSVVAMTATAEYWLNEMTDSVRTKNAPLPLTVRSVVAKLVVVEQGLVADTVTPKVRLRTRSGQWLVLYASRLLGMGDQAQISVVFERAQPAEISPLIMQAYDLTKRESEVTQCVLLGLSTAEISAKLYISQHTVQDHLKAIFGKVDVNSRGELARRIFIEHYQPRMGKMG